MGVGWGGGGVNEVEDEKCKIQDEGDQLLQRILRVNGLGSHQGTLSTLLSMCCKRLQMQCGTEKKGSLADGRE